MDNQLNFNEKITYFKNDFSKMVPIDTFQSFPTFQATYNKNTGDWPVIKAQLEKQGFETALVNNLEFTDRLTEWSNNNSSIITGFQNDGTINSMRDLAIKFNKKAFIDKVKPMAPGETDKEKKEVALNLHHELFQLEPTASVINIIKDPQVPILNNEVGATISSILERNTTFNIKTNSIYEIINKDNIIKELPVEKKELVVNELKTLQRITALTPDTDAIPVLYNNHLHSAMRISDVPKTQFLVVMSNSGMDQNAVSQIYTNAQKIRTRNEQAIMALRETYQRTGIAMVDQSLNREEGAMAPSTLQASLEKHNLSWDLLFGDADTCECEECTSVYSATSYYVELLQYLRNNNLDGDPSNPSSIKIKANPKDISGTPLEKLFARRPDLGSLELTCKNTNKVLPYIDLVNEVMENYVATKKLKPFNIGDEESSELLAEPQNTEYEAYNKLKEKVYPFTLPYHQPIDAQRIYLNYLDTSRYELINTFRKSSERTDEEYLSEKERALERAADAEFLGLTLEEYVILTKVGFKSKALMEFDDKKAYTDAEYKKLIGLKQVSEYYGFDHDQIMLGTQGLTQIKKEFLHRTGIDYVNLVDLLKTSYINPHIPKGKSKIILESLRLSYRFLQNYVKVYGIDKMAADLATGVILAKKLATKQDTATQAVPEFTAEEIIQWVKSDFVKIGKMIVIESGGRVGETFTNGKIFNSTNQVTASVIDGRIYMNQQHVASIDKLTGQISPIANTNPIPWKDLVYISNQGEKGIFLAHNNIIYGVILEQPDSCDLDTARLQHLDGTPLTSAEYEKIHRFIRLWRKMGWKMDEMDQVIADLSSDIDQVLIHQLAAVKKIQDITGLELKQLLAFWGNINTTGENSLYRRLFLTHNLVRIDNIFQPDRLGNYLSATPTIEEHLPIVMASLNLSADDLHLLVQNLGDDKLTLENVSYHYRYRLLSKLLGIRIPDLIGIKPLFGDMFLDAYTTLEFLNRWERMEESGFTHYQLNYLIHDVDDEKKPWAPTSKEMLQLNKTLYDGLKGLDKHSIHHFIINTLSNFADLDAEMTDELVSKVLITGIPLEPIYSIFEEVKDFNNQELAMSDAFETAVILFKKTAMLVSIFDLSVEEVRFFEEYKADFDHLDFKAPTLAHWLRLESYTRLRHSLPQYKLTLVDFWKWINGGAVDETILVDKIVELTSWKKEHVEKLTAADHFNLRKLQDYRNEVNLLRLKDAIVTAEKVGFDIDKLFDWTEPGSDFKTCRDIADSIKNTIRAKYNQSDWERVVKPLHDQLRDNQKNALTGYLLQQQELKNWNVTDEDGLFEYFLIDVQMEPCMETSRIKQAISSLQLFIQRCFLGLEKGISPNTLDRPRWDWMRNYRVWEANRKVFLYPENWIESNLRDDKSPFFKELESELLQKDISRENVTDALKSYLYKLAEVDNMEVVGFYIDGTRVGAKWIDDSKLHVFSRTRNVPYFYFYRYLDLAEMNWYPWEKMQIDIPSYDVEDMVKTDSGVYLIPVVWNKRLFVFFPQIMKKTAANVSSGSYNSLGTKEIETTKPIEHFEIKMAWSEYRNGKWTQKQISKTSVFSDQLHLDEFHRIEHLKFVPKVLTYRVLIYVDDNKDKVADKGFKGIFEFNGSSLKTIHESLSVSEGIPIANFHHHSEDNKMYTWQLDPSGKRYNKDIYFEEKNAREFVTGLGNNKNFFHTCTYRLLSKINNHHQLETFFEDNLLQPEDNFGPFDHDGNVKTPDIYHELKRPYSLYNWELFFHMPILLADELSKAQNFEEAMKWFHFVFNPFAEGKEANRFWRFKPFQKINSHKILDNIFYHLKGNTADQTISEWRNKPFMPHVVARSRPVAYMKWVVMKYIDNLIAWGDDLFRQGTIESINQATQLYVLAGHILGPRPNYVPKRGTIKPQTYLGLLDKWDAFGNAMVELELAAPFSNQLSTPHVVINHEIASVNIFGVASTLYFCIPNNPKLRGYWDTVADRLYKIRHCQNMDGAFQKLALFEPPIDPALLVKAAGQGLNLGDVLQSINSPMPNYRFYFLLQKALELCNELKSLGGAMLSAIEKHDNETISIIRAKHEGVMQNLLMEIKSKQIEEAEKNIEGLMQNRKTIEARMKYYLKLSGQEENLVPDVSADFAEIPNDIVTVNGDSGLKLIPFEKEEMEKASAAQDWQRWIGIVETTASVMHLIPEVFADVKPLGVGAGSGWGGINLGNAAQAVARGMQVHASDLSFASSNSGKKGGFTRALQERIFQANAAGYELKQIDKQITSQEIRIEIAKQEIANQQKAIHNAVEVEEFIKNKYSNDELYNWMRGSLKTLYHQVYTLAYDLAKKAEKTYWFERGVSSSNYIQAGYFNAGRDGLLAGEQLYVALKQLEAAYQNERGHDYEMTKHISLHQLNPLAILELREKGTCQFALPEVLFDMDYPGHYKRRIKSVSISIPCIAGPYTGINAKLRLMSNGYRNEETDTNLSSYDIPIDAIATSSAQNDSGMFELNFKDERYLPFEGAGVISSWLLELPAIRQFDYKTISDVVIHLKYTACGGSEALSEKAIDSVKTELHKIGQNLNETGLHIGLTMKHDLPNEWHLLKKNGNVELTIDKTRLPFMAQMAKAEAAIEKIIFLAKGKENTTDFSIHVEDGHPTITYVEELNLYRADISSAVLGKSFKLSLDPLSLSNLEELMMVVKYRFTIINE